MRVLYFKIKYDCKGVLFQNMNLSDAGQVNGLIKLAQYSHFFSSSPLPRFSVLTIAAGAKLLRRVRWYKYIFLVFQEILLLYMHG